MTRANCMELYCETDGISGISKNTVLYDLLFCKRLSTCFELTDSKIV